MTGETLDTECRHHKFWIPALGQLLIGKDEHFHVKLSLLHVQGKGLPQLAYLALVYNTKSVSYWRNEKDMELSRARKSDGVWIGHSCVRFLIHVNKMKKYTYFASRLKDGGSNTLYVSE